MEYYIIDAFTSELFQGNPAGVCVTPEALSAELMQRIAAENNLPETAFVRKIRDGYELRWFTPGFEIDLCGHATLAAACVVSNFVEPGAQRIRFSTRSGTLEVTRNGRLYDMIFPNRAGSEITLSSRQLSLTGCRPAAVCSARDLFLILDSEQDVLNYTPDYAKLQSLTDWLGVVVTAPGIRTDFVSRYFCPELNAEDPVTGSSHCTLIPYWSRRLNKHHLTVAQLSPRGGLLDCELLGDEAVRISGEAVVFLKGEILVNGV